MDLHLTIFVLSKLSFSFFMVFFEGTPGRVTMCVLVKMMVQHCTKVILEWAKKEVMVVMLAVAKVVFQPFSVVLF
jgi:hypothetical protein